MSNGTTYFSYIRSNFLVSSYRVRPELAVDDRKDSATFVVFNKELTKLIKQDATTLALEEMSGGGGQDLPRCLEDLAGKDYVFQIRITPCRFIPNQCTFTVSAISDDIFFGGEGGQATTAASYTVDTEKRAMGVDKAHPPDFEDKEKAANAPIVFSKSLSSCPNVLRSHVLEVSSGADIIESVNTYARRRGRGVSVLSSNGMVANVVLRQPVTVHGNNCGTGAGVAGVVTLHGKFDIIPSLVRCFRRPCRWDQLQQEAFKIRHFLQLQPISFFQPDMSHQFTSSRSRFRVELTVDDGKDSATFVVFAKEMTKLIKKEATNLALEGCLCQRDDKTHQERGNKSGS
ncbi:hypothetical protein IGI04_018501 [Brassica rapa subsp. trilocularis]|uniref:PPC domain-containing protein n=1 Tax=Brassica rapa subsp. trilocularis TaxID=1813537 RepID=A0ABQ7MDL4_BRACM|nr:hypothetical protein IGI04_018501 [Brassica rapa subsp. trilocularis]